MYILIVGAGEVGNYLATILVDEGHDVAVVERDEQLARKLRNELDALVVVGTGVNQATLKQAGVESADLVIAVTEVDEVNLIACMAAKQVGRRELRTIARVREASYDGEDAMSATELGIDMLVGPEQSLAERVTNLLGFSALVKCASLPTAEFSSLKCRCPKTARSSTRALPSSRVSCPVRRWLSASTVPTAWSSPTAALAFAPMNGLKS